MSQEYIVRGSSINTRQQASSIVEQAVNSGCKAIDLTNVEFVSRSSADELSVLADEYDLELRGASGDVEKMFEVIRSHSAGLTA